MVAAEDDTRSIFSADSDFLHVAADSNKISGVSTSVVTSLEDDMRSIFSADSRFLAADSDKDDSTGPAAGLPLLVKVAELLGSEHGSGDPASDCYLSLKAVPDIATLDARLLATIDIEPPPLAKLANDGEIRGVSTRVVTLEDDMHSLFSPDSLFSAAEDTTNKEDARSVVSNSSEFVRWAQFDWTALYE